MLGLPLTSLQVAGLGEPIHGSAGSLLLHMIRVAVIGGVVAALVVALGFVLPSRVRTWAGDAEAPRPRWLYLLAGICSLAIASTTFVLLTSRAETGIFARLSYTAVIWCGLYGLVLIGRAASWGRVRIALWWAPFISDRNDRAKRELGWRPRPAETTIVETAESLRDLGLLEKR